MIKNNLSAPLHDGAAKYYKEQRLDVISPVQVPGRGHQCSRPDTFSRRVTTISREGMRCQMTQDESAATTKLSDRGTRGSRRIDGYRRSSSRTITQIALCIIRRYGACSGPSFRCGSPRRFPTRLGFGVFSSGEARPIHLAFALFLAYLAYPGVQEFSAPTTDPRFPTGLLGHPGAALLRALSLRLRYRR